MLHNVNSKQVTCFCIGGGSAFDGCIRFKEEEIRTTFGCLIRRRALISLGKNFAQYLHKQDINMVHTKD